MDEMLKDGTTVEVDEVAINGEQPEEVFAEDELASMFAVKEEEVEEKSTLSEDLAGFANGFPDWDLKPPKKQ